jgi:hypothetical protein
VGFKRAYIIILIVVFLMSCHSDREKDKDAKFAQIYGEILFLTEKFKNDTIKLKMKIDSVLSANKIEMREIDSIAKVYSKDPEKWAKFFDEAKKYLDKKSLNAQPQRH